jgi:hypothetical protein
VIGWALLLQAGLPTVGDTIWVRRMVAAPPGRAVRAAEWTPADPVEVLGRPRVVVHGDSVEVAYPVTVWASGSHIVQVPGPLVIGADGRVDSLASTTVTLTAGTVLPPRPPDSLTPQPAASTIATHERTPRPLIALLALALVALLPIHLWWRRRGRTTPIAPVGPAPAADPPVERWAEAGEPRAVIGAAVARLREGIAAKVPEARAELDTDDCLAVLARLRPDWPLVELGDVLRALDEARFAHGPDVDALGMHRWAAELARRLPDGRAA